MSKKDLMNKLTSKLGRVGLQIKKYSPEILVTVGVVGSVASTVMACKATTKLSAITDKAKEDIDAIHKASEAGEVNGEEYTEQDSKKDLGIVYAQTGIKIAKLYAPAATIGALSIMSIFTSNSIHRKRNIAMAAAYATIDKSFKEYRQRLIDRFGEKVDKELKYNIKAQEYEEEVTGEDGEPKTAKSTINVANGYSEYAQVFDESCNDWSKNYEYNMTFLKVKQNYLNDLLVSRGHIFLNEVYDELGFDRTSQGAVVGWIYNPKDSSKHNCVDFGIFGTYTKRDDSYTGGYGKSIILDFNVDGIIFDLI